MYPAHQYSMRWPKCAFSPFDRFHVVKGLENTPIEGHFNEGRANYAAQVMNEHNERNGHADRYKVIPNPDYKPCT